MKTQRQRSRAHLFYIPASVLFIGAVITGVYLAINPPNRIRVTAWHLPSDTEFISLVSESNGFLQNMDYSPKFFLPLTMRPAECIWSHPVHDSLSNAVIWDNIYVHWRWGEHYGVVTMESNGNWRVTWFAANEVPIKGHWFILGNGEAHFDMSKGKSAVMAREQLEDLGLWEAGQRFQRK